MAWRTICSCHRTLSAISQADGHIGISLHPDSFIWENYEETFCMLRLTLEKKKTFLFSYNRSRRNLEGISKASRRNSLFTHHPLPSPPPQGGVGGGPALPSLFLRCTFAWRPLSKRTESEGTANLHHKPKKKFFSKSWTSSQIGHNRLTNNKLNVWRTFWVRHKFVTLSSPKTKKT